MRVVRVHEVHGRSSDRPYIVLERASGETFDLDLRGNGLAAVYRGVLHGMPIELVTRSGRAEFDTHADWAISALGALMFAGGCAGVVFGPDRRRPR